jgi:hypothetical protein
MSLTSSQRPNRELGLLMLAIALVAALCLPVWWWSQHGQSFDPTGKWTPQRLGRLLIGPEQCICYVFFTWAGLILLRRQGEVERQRAAFGLGLLPTEEGARILPEDARPLLRKMEPLTAQRGPLILATMIRLALGKYAISRSAPDVGEVVRTQAEVEQGRLVSGMGMVNYLCWGIPALGFLGTVRGLAGALTMSTSEEENLRAFLDQATGHLNFAFDCTLVALTLSVIVMCMLHIVQRNEESLIIDCQQFCQEHLLLRLYDPHPEAGHGTRDTWSVVGGLEREPV